MRTGSASPFHVGERTLALVAFEEGYSPIGRAVGGVVEYQRAGSAVFRGLVRPNYPGTEAQLSETAGVTAAARGWAYRMSEEDRLTYDSNGCLIEISYEVWIWLRSILTSAGEGLEIGPSGGPAPEPPVLDGAVLDPTAGVFEADFSPPAGTTGGLILVSASRPVSPGRIPRQTEQRVIGAFDVGETADLSGAYTARFGGFGGSCPIRITYRWIEVSTRVISCPDDTLIYPAAGGFSCSVTCVTCTIPTWGSVSVIVRIDADAYPSDQIFRVVMTTPGFDLPPREAVNHTDTPLDFMEVVGTERTETCVFEFGIGEDPTVLCSDSVTVVISNA